MALISIEKRKKFFKALGLGEYNKANILKFQKKYFVRKQDWDGIYGNDTERLLKHVYNVTFHSKNFVPEEFKCECGGKYCTGYPDYMKYKQMELLQEIRDHYKRPLIVTCGLRCKRYNAMLNGSTANSKHMTGKATDYYMKGVTDTLANRKKTIKYLKKLKNHNYTYGNGINSFGSYINAPYMGNALHTDSK